MKTGLFFGSFNPVHHGHLAIAGYLAEFTNLDEVWFVVSPENPHKKRQTLLGEQERLEMVELAIKDDFRFRSSDIEFNMPRPSYTIDTIVRLEEKFPQRTFAFIMGADNLQSLPKWKNYEQLISGREVFVYPRHGVSCKDWEQNDNIHLTEAPKMEISASFIRNALKDGKNIRYFVPDTVLNYIEKWGYFQN